MIAIARGSITEPDKLGPFIDDEMRVVEQLKAEGVMKAVYRRAAGPGVVIVLEGETIDAIRERMNTLPFVIEGTHDPRIRRGLRDLRTLAARHTRLPAAPGRRLGSQ
jgi:hypothetical protein